VVVVTGDNQATAEAVCRSIGALGEDAGLDSQQLSSLTGAVGYVCVGRVSGKETPQAPLVSLL
jgi:magnesium-transporting ATPase (P-type)